MTNFKYLITFLSKYVKIVVLSIAVLITTSCGVFIMAVGGVESDLSNHPQYAHLFSRIYEFKKDVVLAKFKSDYTTNIYYIVLPGTNSGVPKTIEIFESDPESYYFVKGFLRAGAKFKISKVAKIYTPSGSQHVTVYIDVFGYDTKGNKVDAAMIYSIYGKDAYNLDPCWVQEVEYP